MVRLTGIGGRRHLHVHRSDVTELADRPLGILQGLAVLALDVGGLAGAVALDRAGDDHRRTTGGRHGLVERAVDLLDIMAVDLERVPAVGLGARGVGVEVPAVHRLSALTEPVDVHDRHQLVEPLYAGVLNRLPDRAFGHLGVTAQAPDAVGQAVQVAAAEREPGRDREALSQRAGRDVDPRQRRCRVALQTRSEFPEGQQLVIGDRAGGVEYRIHERRGVALGEDQVIVVGVGGGIEVVVQVVGHQDRHQVGGRHRGRGMT